MKNFLKYVAALAIVGAFFVACSDWTDPEREITQHPDQQSPILRDNAYYQALREYKKTKHKIAFGWYGSWTAVGLPDPPAECSRLDGYHLHLEPVAFADPRADRRQGVRAEDQGHEGDLHDLLGQDARAVPHRDRRRRIYRRGHRGLRQSLLQGLDGQVQLRRHRRRLRTRLRRFGAVRGT